MATGLSVDGNILVRELFSRVVAMDGNKRRRWSLAGFGISSRLYDSCMCWVLRSASQQRGRSPSSLLKVEECFSSWSWGWCVSGESYWHRSSSQVCRGSVRGTSAHTGLVFSMAKPRLALFGTPAEELVVVEGKQQTTARYASKVGFEPGTLGTALKMSSPACWHLQEGTSAAQDPSKQYPARSAAVSASNSIYCLTEVTLNAGCGQDFPRQEIAWYQCYSQSWQHL